MSVRLTSERVGDVSIDITISSDGSFNAEFNGQDFSAKQLSDLREQLSKAVKKAAQQGSVDVTVLGLLPVKSRNRGYDDSAFEPGAGFINAKLRAAHERQHATWLLVTDDDRISPKKNFQVTGYSRQGVIARRITPEEGLRYLELCEAKRAAEVALEDVVGALKIDPAAALKAARTPAK